MARKRRVTRADGRAFNELRPVRITTDYQEYPEGSALIACGNTRVLCAASVQDRQPPHLVNTDRGWVTAEYAMLPRATHTRSSRESVRGRLGGRTQEIQRLIGRALRAAVDLPALGPRTVILDCDVLQADGGTRTAAITGAYVALALALRQLVTTGMLPSIPLKTAVAAVSVGIVHGAPLPRSLLPGGLPRERRSQRGDDRRGAVYRGPRHGRGHDVLAPRVEIACSTSRIRGSSRCSRPKSKRFAPRWTAPRATRLSISREY